MVIFEEETTYGAQYGTHTWSYTGDDQFVFIGATIISETDVRVENITSSGKAVT